MLKFSQEIMKDGRNGEKGRALRELRVRNPRI